jgi:hypothetical protein
MRLAPIEDFREKFQYWDNKSSLKAQENGEVQWKPNSLPTLAPRKNRGLRMRERFSGKVFRTKAYFPGVFSYLLCH